MQRLDPDLEPPSYAQPGDAGADLRSTEDFVLGPGYRGEVKVCLINHDLARPVRFSRGDRIAQLVIQPVTRAAFAVVEQLPESIRGTGGYGSTGGVLVTAHHAQEQQEA